MGLFDFFKTSQGKENKKILNLTNQFNDATKSPKRVLPKSRGKYREAKIDEIHVRENYEYGKKMYEEKFGNLAGKPLNEVLANIEFFYKDDYDYDYVYDYLQVRQVVEVMGYNYREADIWWNGDYEIDGELFLGMKEEYRNICRSKDLVTDDELKDFFSNYTDESNLYTNEETRLVEVNERKRIIKNNFMEQLKKTKYDPKTKSWQDFDINHQFLQVRGLMINDNNPIPHYVWKLIPGNPFDRVYKICKDYMKWKGVKKTTELVFENVCKWENSEIYQEGEIFKKYEHPMWINWNKVGKDFLSMKTKLKKENLDGIEWLKQIIGRYIESRIEFYKQFGKNSPFYIQNDIIEKFHKI